MYKRKMDKRMRVYQAIVIILFTLVGVVLGNSMYLDGYSAETINTGETYIYSSNGYTQEGKYFEYTGADFSYVQVIAKNTDTEQIMFVFGQKAQKDTAFSLYYVDEMGNVLENYSQGVWKKGKYTATVDVIPGVYNSYLFSMASNFSLENIYYAKQNGVSSNPRILVYLFGLIFGIIFAIMVECVSGMRNLLYSIEKKRKHCVEWCKKEQKTIGMYMLKLGIFAGVAIVTMFLLNYFGKIKLSEKITFVSIMIGCLLGIYFCFRKYAAKKIELIGCLTILIVGSIFSIVEPPNVGVSWDDEAHYRNSLSVSHLLDKQISMADVLIQNDYQNVALNKYNYGRTEQRRYIEITNELIQNRYYTERYALASWNLNISYLPSAIGLIIGRGIGLSFYWTIILGRWMNVLLVAILSFFSMKALKTGKIVVLLIQLIPTNLFLMSNYNYDTWLTSWSLLGLSLFFGEWQRRDRKLSRNVAWKMSIFMFLAVMPKLIYFPLTFILIFMPECKFENKKQVWFYRSLILGSTFLPFIVVYCQNFLNGLGQGDVRGGEAVNATTQMDFVKEQPMQVFNTLVTFLKGYLNPLIEGREYLINQAYFGYINVHHYVVIAIILFGAIISREKHEAKFPWWTKIGCLFVYAIIGAMAAFSMYITFTAVGADTVAGCQGRYIIPALFPALFVCSRFSMKTFVKDVVREENINLLLMLLLCCVSLYGMWKGCLSIY